jgi:hypothetical protein
VAYDVDMPTITLSDNQPFEVRQLGIFELDKLTPKPIGPFTYTMKTITGKEFEVEFDINAYDTPPIDPQVHSPEPETPEWYLLHDWQLYQAAMLHESKRQEILSQYYDDVVEHIIGSCCKGDTRRIVTREDWLKIYEAALVPQLTLEDIATILRQTYNAEFNGQDIFDALQNASKGHGSYNTIRLWENKLMVEMQLTELEYALMPVEERARKVCALFLSDIMTYLETDLQMKKSKTNG